MLIDSTASGPIFVVGGDMFDRESLAAAVPLGAFAVAPERLFARQRVGWAAGELAVWDVDPDDDQADARPGIDTRVYVAREAFADFRAVAAAARGAARVAAAGGGASLLALAAPSTAPSSAAPSTAPSSAATNTELETRLAALESRLAELEVRLGR